MKIVLGEFEITDAKVGTDQVTDIYIGDRRVWSKNPGIVDSAYWYDASDDASMIDLDPRPHLNTWPSAIANKGSGQAIEAGMWRPQIISRDWTINGLKAVQPIRWVVRLNTALNEGTPDATMTGPYFIWAVVASMDLHDDAGACFNAGLQAGLRTQWGHWCANSNKNLVGPEADTWQVHFVGAIFRPDGNHSKIWVDYETAEGDAGMERLVNIVMGDNGFFYQEGFTGLVGEWGVADYDPLDGEVEALRDAMLAKWSGPIVGPQTPTTIQPTCWLRAQDLTAWWYDQEVRRAEDGGFWFDASGNGRYAIPVQPAQDRIRWSRGPSPTGADSLYTAVGGQFTTSAYWQLPDLGMTTAGEAWVVARAQTDKNSLWHLSNSSVEAHFPWNGTSIYENFGISGATRFSWTEASTLNNRWVIYRVANDGSTWLAEVDGARKSTQSNVPFSAPTNPTLGAGQNNNTVDYRMNGMISEFIAFDHVLPPAEATAVYNYLRDVHIV